ncbi:MAG: pyridine nucleotide-disulfide oxidoreductase [Gammaproteobacteria bacterium]|nr:pyridine nucleotide-disulfide oxidoreductase [Gammaproteobacteria bacterium]
MASIEKPMTIEKSDMGIPATLSQRFNYPGRFIWNHLAWFGFVGTMLIVYLGWDGRQERNIAAESGLGYYLGIVGASMMAALLLYPLRKRIPSLRVLGPTRIWFRVHMLLGIIGPVLILFHSNFTVGSLNSRVALFCTLLVAVSGLVGRYLYAQIHRGLYGEKTNLRSLVDEMHSSLEQISTSDPVLEQFLKQLTAFDESVLQPPENFFRSTLRPIVFAFRTRWAYLRMSWAIRQTAKPASVGSEQFFTHQKKLVTVARQNLRLHLKQVRKVAHLRFFDRLFSLWHILHLPFFVLLVISAAVHIFAVHMY